MYKKYFGLSSAPFSIVPDHRVMYMSGSHREAVAHLLYSLKQPGGFVQLTGEVGTGKTTVSRYLLQHLPENVDVALLLNPRINEREMLEVICEELGIRYPVTPTLKDLISALNEHLLETHAKGRHTVLIVDEAQNLSRRVLEQIRLLTNLETSTDKLLQIILIGQPELVKLLNRHDLRQLSQRIVGRFKLEPLDLKETREYIRYRLKQAGCERPLFTDGATRLVHKLSGGVPRVINVICDSALMAAYSHDRDRVSRALVSQAAKEILPEPNRNRWGWLSQFVAVPLVAGGLLLIVVALNDATGFTERLQQFWQQDKPAWVEIGATPNTQTAPNSVSSLPAESVAASVERSDNPQPATPREPSPDRRTESSVEEKDQLVVSKTVQPQSQTDSAGVPKDSGFDLLYRLGVPFKTN